MLNDLIKKINFLPQNERSLIGIKINKIKERIIFIINKERNKFNNNNNNSSKYNDISLPGIGIKNGNLHILSIVIDEVESYFKNLGFDVIDGLEIDNEYYNFDSLNIKKDHPSRNMNDTFYITNDILLRTHTSNMQIHFMENNIPPIKIISSGKVYRKDSDSTHSPMFHQIEGLLIDKNTSIIDLKNVLINFLIYFFNKNLKYRFRSSYFPFTEPSMEVDIECIICNGNKCNLCNNTGFIEVLGCGMVHPNVLNNCSIDSKNYKGFAFGIGIERIAMIKYNIDDIKLYFENNLDFLKQFN